VDNVESTQVFFQRRLADLLNTDLLIRAVTLIAKTASVTKPNCVQQLYKQT